MRLKTGLVLASLLLATSFSAMADQFDSWNLVVGGTAMNDSNLFRRPAGQEKSDQLTAINLGFRVNKAYSLQRFTVDASVTDFKYSKNSNFDYLGKNVNAAWLWSITPQLHGNLSTSYSESLNSFVDYALTQKNLRTINTERLDLEWEAMGRLHLVGGVNHTEQKNSQAILAEGDYNADAAEYGVKYVLPSGSQMTLLGRNTNGEYKNRPLDAVGRYDTGFSQRDTEFRFFWLLSDKSRFNGRVASIDRQHDNFADRDYKGTIGSLDYTWDLTSKLRLAAGWKRDLVSYQISTPFFINFYQVDGYNVSPIWQVTPKITLRARYSQDLRDYRSASQSAFKDTLRQSSLALDWAPLRTMTFSVSAQRDTRSSTTAGRDFSSNMLNLSANLAF